MQGTRVQSLVWEDPMCCRAAKPESLHRKSLQEAPTPEAHPSQQEKPPQGEVQAKQLESSIHSLQLEKTATNIQHNQRY